MNALEKLQSCVNYDMSTLRELPIGEFCELELSYLEVINVMREFGKNMTVAKELRLKDDDAALRKLQGKATGTVNLAYGNFQVKSVITPKKTFNQNILSSVAERINDDGGNAAAFMDISYKVNNDKLKSMTQSLFEEYGNDIESAVEIENPLPKYIIAKVK